LAVIQVSFFNQDASIGDALIKAGCVMEQQKLRELLESLHQELEHVDSLDESTSRVLCDLKEDLGRLAGQEGAAGICRDEPLMERMNNAVDHFEADHPKLSMALQHVLDSLAKMGL
jgi:hypothetical protein